MIERQIDVETKDGRSTTFIVHPERGRPHPVVFFFMDAPGIREELRDMARRIASVGYYVMLPNLYYRAGMMELGPLSRDPESPERKRMMELMHGINIPKVMSDLEAMIAFADRDPAAKKGPAGAVGYCMSGQYAINAAAHRSDRITAAISMYGTFLMTDKPDSPHLAARKTKAELYFGCAETDHWAPMDMVRALAADLRAHDVEAEVEVYPGAEHGFAFPQRPAYHKPSAERHWERMFALIRRRIG
jgi:carboxymethylenebutenolidase